MHTTASGAGVAQSVIDFPVLIRLTAGNFDFSQAKNNGTDLRFIQSGAGFLSCEIERWDAPYKRADSPLCEFSGFNKSDSWQACTTKATARQWTLVTGVRLCYMNQRADDRLVEFNR